jgi:hypothetical protein
MSLGYIDTAIGFITIMLLLSLVVTTVVQMIIWAVNLRGTNLASGLHKLLNDVGGVDPKTATAVLNGILQYPALTTFMQRKITAIRPAELQKLAPIVIDQLVTAGKINPAQAMALKTRVATAVTDWFDPIVDRTSEVFIMWTRAITSVVALSLAFYFGIDGALLLKEISTDRELRAKLVVMADATLQTSNDVRAKASDDEYRDREKQLVSLVGKLEETKLDFFTARNPKATWWGMLFTGILLSLGAPFWHTMLRNVVALRPVVANKVDKERES